MPRVPVPPLAASYLAVVGLVCACAVAAAQRTDSRPERTARRAQRAFEALRRELLSEVPARTGGCDVTIGRFCLWDDDADTPLPPEGPRTARARDGLRARLDSLGAVDSTDDFIAGQRVRYAIEVHDVDGAAAAVEHCAATPWWCEALRGFVRHRIGAELASAAAFDSALAAMPDTLRCAWLDVRQWLPSGTRIDPTRRADDCAGRAATGDRLFWLAAPLLTWRRDAARNEFFARRTLAAMLTGTATPELASWSWELAELSLRYGRPDQWAREENPVGSAQLDEPGIVGNDPLPGFSVVPDRRALEAPFSSRPNDWRLVGDRAAIVRYAPGWLRLLDTMPVQIARFRRGADSMVVVAAYDGRVLVDSGSTDLIAAASLSAGLSPESTLAMDLATHAATGALVLVAPARPALAAVEVFDSTGRRAARWRAGIAPLPDSAPISDLLVGLAVGARFDPRSPDSAARDALPVLRVTSRDTLALYWEDYLRPPPGVPVRVTVRLTRSAGVLGRIGRALGLAHGGAGPAVSWEDPLADSASARALRFGIAQVPAGRYRIEVTLRAGSVRGIAARDIEVVDGRH